MNLRRKLFSVWCGFTIMIWLIAIFGGDGARILLKFQAGGWRAAYVQFVFTLVLAGGIPLMVLLIGRAAFWISDQLS
jgi:hypothetical protein